MGKNTKEISRIKQYNEMQLLSKYRTQIMGFAALWILIFHVWRPIWYGHKFLFQLEKFIKIIGYYGVDIFFFLSGIGLTYSINKTNTCKFYYKRIKRIILPFLIIASILKIFNNWTMLEFIKRITFYSFYTESIYRLLWFIPAIVTLYTFFPLYYKVFKKILHKTIFTTAIILIISFILVVFRKWIRPDLYGFINRIPIFILGILLGWKEQNKEITYNKNRYITYMFMLVFGLVIAYFIKMEGWYFLNKKFDVFLPNAFVAISISFLFAKMLESISNYKIGKLIINSLNYMGIMSLELYCAQEVFLSIRYKFSGIKNNFITNIIIFVVVFLLATILYIINRYFWILIEKIYNWIKKGKK